ncbi:hypothetical protein ACFL3J_00020 [Candidatus Omnitrophota bacterium]
MKKFVVILIALSLVMVSMPAFAAKGQRGASTTAYEHASDDAIFHRVGDWFATVGKSDTEKKAIIAQRKAKRAAARAQKKAEQQKRKMEKEAERSKKEMKAKMKGIGQK